MNDRHTPTLGAVLQAARQQQGLGIRQLAALVGVAPSQVSRWESGRIPQAHNLMTLAQQLELPASELFALAGLAVPRDLPSLPALLRSQYDLPPEAVAEVQKNIERIAKKYRKN